MSENEDPGLAKYRERFFNFYDQRVMDGAWTSAKVCRALSHAAYSNGAHPCCVIQLVYGGKAYPSGIFWDERDQSCSDVPYVLEGLT